MKRQMLLLCLCCSHVQTQVDMELLAQFARGVKRQVISHT